jgi:hypothetical protein
MSGRPLSEAGRVYNGSLKLGIFIELPNKIYLGTRESLLKSTGGSFHSDWFETSRYPEIRMSCGVYCLFSEINDRNKFKFFRSDGFENPSLLKRGVISYNFTANQGVIENPFWSSCF